MIEQENRSHGLQRKWNVVAILIAATMLSACGGGGGGASANSASPPISTPAPTPSPTPSATPYPLASPVGAPTLGPILVTWQGVGGYSAQSDPNFVPTFYGQPNDPTNYPSYVTAPSIIFTAVGQSVQATVTQASYGLVPFLTLGIGTCPGYTVTPSLGKLLVTFTADGNGKCNLQLNSLAYPASSVRYPGSAAVMHVISPGSGSF